MRAYQAAIEHINSLDCKLVPGCEELLRVATLPGGYVKLTARAFETRGAAEIGVLEAQGCVNEVEPIAGKCCTWGLVASINWRLARFGSGGFELLRLSRGQLSH